MKHFRSSTWTQDRGSLMITAIYLLTGGLWILLSDSLLARMTTTHEAFMTLSIYKGWGYVLATGGMLYLLIQRNNHILRNAGKNYSLLAENISDVIWLLDLDAMRFTYVSPSVRQLCGLTPEEVMREDPLETVSSTGLNYIAEVFPSRLEEFKHGAAGSYTDETEIHCRDGSTVWVEMTSRFALNLETDHTEVYGSTRDISARKKTEQALHDHAERQTALYNVLRKVSGELDPNVIAQIGVDAILQMGRWQSVAISLLEANEREWLVRAVGGPLSGPVLGPHSLNEGVTGRAYRTNQTQLVRDVTTDPDFFTSSNSPIKSDLAVPIRRSQRVIGALNIESDQVSGFTSEDVALAESLADTISLALANAHQQETLLRREADLAKAQAMAHLGSYSWDLQSGRMEWSDELKSLWGVERLEPTDELANSLLHPDDCSRVQEARRCALKEDGLYN
ncbi:MAG: GAF domain-containing protein, partial [Chloroflexota bacterium]